MKLTVEISMYPFREDYRTAILGFIEKLNAYPNLRVETTATATTVSGDYLPLMGVLTELFAWSHHTYGRAVYVTKFLPGFAPD